MVAQTTNYHNADGNDNDDQLHHSNQPGYCTMSCAHAEKMRHFPYLMSAPCAHYAHIYFTTVHLWAYQLEGKGCTVCWSWGDQREKERGKEPMADFRMMQGKHLEYNSFRDDHMTQLNMVPF